ncbi:hypothetical protein Hanom_Chr13g01217451 [Helianthus anomalus]
MVELYSLGGMPKATVIVGARSRGSVSSKGQPYGATPTSIPVEEDAEVDPFPELTRKNGSKRQREESMPDPTLGAKKIASGKPSIGKKGSVRSLYTHTSPGKCLVI